MIAFLTPWIILILIIGISMWDIYDWLLIILTSVLTAIVGWYLGLIKKDEDDNIF